MNRPSLRVTGTGSHGGGDERRGTERRPSRPVPLADLAGLVDDPRIAIQVDANRLSAPGHLVPIAGEEASIPARDILIDAIVSILPDEVVPDDPSRAHGT